MVFCLSQVFLANTTTSFQIYHQKLQSSEAKKPKPARVSWGKVKIKNSRKNYTKILMQNKICNFVFQV
jgi:hypothetical protein